VYHAFVRAADRTITAFDAPAAGTGIDQGTFAYGVDDAGSITGTYLDAGNTYHGFVRTADGVITTFGATGGGTGPTQGTLGYSIDSAGAVAGFRYGTNSAVQSFVRDASLGFEDGDGPTT
jgi:hypothetical protein